MEREITFTLTIDAQDIMVRYRPRYFVAAHYAHFEFTSPHEPRRRIPVSETGYPIGIYLMTDAPIEKGALVIFCPTDAAIFRQAKERGYIGAGFCPGGTSHMIKKIMAATNDAVEFSGKGVLVNGALLPNSKPMDKDAEERPLSPPKADIAALDDHTVLLMSDYNPKSFDARYFGLMDKTQVISVVRPVWVW